VLQKLFPNRAFRSETRSWHQTFSNPRPRVQHDQSEKRISAVHVCMSVAVSVFHVWCFCEVFKFGVCVGRIDVYERVYRRYLDKE
jgi:hypothetical protein